MFCIKRALMKSILQKRKQNNPFIFENAEAYTFPTEGDGTQNNSYYFSAHDREKQISLYTRLGLRDNGTAEVWMYFEQEGRVYVHEQLYYTKEEKNPLCITRTQSGWHFSFDGKLTEENGKQVTSKIYGDFTPSGKPVDFFTDMPTVRMATAVAQDKWTKEYFADMQKNNSVHYEQEGRLVGEVQIGKQKLSYDMPTLRDHSFGRRVWGYMNNHVWLAAVCEDCMLNFSLVSYPSISVLEVGHLRIGESVEFVTKAHYNRNEVVTGTIPPALHLTLTTDKGNTVEVDVTLLRKQDYPFENAAYTLTEGIGQFTINGTTCRGIYEIGFNADKTRFMNGKQIDKIKE